MILFSLTALTRATRLVQREAKSREIFHTKKRFEILSKPHSISTFNQTSCFISKLFSSTTALPYFKKKAMAEMTPIFLLEEDEEPMATEPIYLSSEESEYSTTNRSPEHHFESIFPDSINQLKASQLKQRANKGTETVFNPPTPNTSVISDDEELQNFIPKTGNPEQYTSQIPQRRNHAIQICQHLQPVPDTPESPPQKIKVRETFSVPTIYLTHRHQHHATISPISRQWLMG